ncbi:MAG: site-2 protease family protein [Clostridia bacterium]|nr:site-2 protease family protein [Clostridia bacterium]
MESLGEKISFILLLLTTMNISSSPHPLLLILCYGIHEMGHIVFAYLSGARLTDFKTSLCKLSIKYDCSCISYSKEALVCAGGIIFNLLFALIFAAPVFNFNENFAFLTVCNLSLALMNLYPVTVLDGGNIVRCIAYRFAVGDTAKKITSAISFVFAFILWLFAVYLQLVFSSNVSVFLISVLLLIEFCLAQ